MHCYWRFKHMFAVYSEVSKNIGPPPFIYIQRIKSELIIEFPYGYAIITPRHVLHGECRSPKIEHEQSQKHEMSTYEKRNRRLFRASEGITKN